MIGISRSAIVAAAGLTAALLGAAPASAQIQPYIGQTMWTAAPFCPRGWTEANGQILAINQNQALFSLLGTTYGGDGRVNFALPNLQARTMLSDGTGPGLSTRVEGQSLGAPSVTLTAQNLPNHSHMATSGVTMRATTGFGDSADPTGDILADSRTFRIYSTGAPNTDMGASAISAQTNLAPAGGNQPIATRSPSLGVRACIALQGIFPSRN